MRDAAPALTRQPIEIRMWAENFVEGVDGVMCWSTQARGAARRGALQHGAAWRTTVQHDGVGMLQHGVACCNPVHHVVQRSALVVPRTGASGF